MRAAAGRAARHQFLGEPPSRDAGSASLCITAGSAVALALRARDAHHRPAPDGRSRTPRSSRSTPLVDGPARASAGSALRTCAAVRSRRRFVPARRPAAPQRSGPRESCATSPALAPRLLGGGASIGRTHRAVGDDTRTGRRRSPRCARLRCCSPRSSAPCC